MTDLEPTDVVYDPDPPMVDLASLSRPGRDFVLSRLQQHITEHGSADEAFLLVVLAEADDQGYTNCTT